MFIHVRNTPLYPIKGEVKMIATLLSKMCLFFLNESISPYMIEEAVKCPWAIKADSENN